MSYLMSPLERVLMAAAAITLAAGCGGEPSADFAVDAPINGADSGAAALPIFGEATRQIDADGDGVNDTDIAEITLLVSDVSDLCAEIGRLGQDFDEALLAGEIAGTVAGVGLSKSGGFPGRGDVLQGVAGDATAVQVSTLLVVSDGATPQAVTFSNGLGELTVDKLVSGKRFSGSFSDTLTVDLVTGADIAVGFSGEFANAEHCQAIDDLLAGE
jgi:hypothetical protein